MLLSQACCIWQFSHKISMQVRSWPANLWDEWNETSPNDIDTILSEVVSARQYCLDGAVFDWVMKSETWLIKTANQDKGRHYQEPITTYRENWKGAKTRVAKSQLVCKLIGWERGASPFSGPITERSEAKPKQSWTTFDILWKAFQ